MLHQKGAIGCVVCLLAGCAAPMPEHFTPAPPLMPTRTVSVEDSAGQPGATSTDAAFAQTLTVTTGGYLTELDLGTQKQSSGNNDHEPPFEVQVEIRSLRDNEPDMNAAALKFSATLPSTALPNAGQMEGGMLRIDLSAQHIRVEKGDRLAIVQSPSVKVDVQFEVTLGRSYSGGELLRFNGGSWQIDSSDAQFRLYADPTAVHALLATEPAASNSAASLIYSGLVPRGQITAQCLPTPRRSMPRPATAPSPAGSWQFRSHIFQDAGKYYLELTTFNGTSRRNTVVGRTGTGPITITLSKIDTPAGRLIFPTREDAYFMNRPMPSEAPQPGEGTVRQYKLSDATSPLTSGKYVISVAYPEQISDHVITINFDVP